jgi:hypothetical protein
MAAMRNVNLEDHCNPLAVVIVIPSSYGRTNLVLDFFPGASCQNVMQPVSCVPGIDLAKIQRLDFSRTCR